MKMYCSGIGGIGLSAYASLMHKNGHELIGSDRTRTALTDTLEQGGMTITTDQSGACVPADADLFVYSEAIPPAAPERVRATELGLRQVSYPQAVGELLQEYETVIAVCGTHGKSSTTAMTTRLLIEAGFDPTVIVGTKVPELNGKNWRQGTKKYFVLEACEYCRSFLQYHPTYILLTNADGDHYDYYRDHHDYLQAFHDFAARVPGTGALITHLSDPDCATIAKGLSSPVINADSEPLISLKTPGRHMQGNAKLVLALARKLGIEERKAVHILNGFAGTWRRLEHKGYLRGTIPVIDDYAHHPREIQASLLALKEAHPDRRIVCVFQPHTHDRALKLYQEFAGAFTSADEVYVTDVYEARKHADQKQVDILTLTQAIAKESGVATTYVGNLAAAKAHVLAHTGEQDLVACLGAGDSTQLAADLTRVEPTI